MTSPNVSRLLRSRHARYTAAGALAGLALAAAWYATPRGRRTALLLKRAMVANIVRGRTVVYRAKVEGGLVLDNVASPIVAETVVELGKTAKHGITTSGSTSGAILFGNVVQMTARLQTAEDSDPASEDVAA